MPNQPESNDLTQWQRFFAIETNNQAWALVETPNRSHDETIELLVSAHASYYHWEKQGIELNTMRAAMLLAVVHAQTGLGDSAIVLGQKMRDFFVEQTDTPDWELAFAHTIYAHCAHTANQLEAYTESYAKAVEALNRIQVPEERAIVQATFDQVPVPS